MSAQSQSQLPTVSKSLRDEFGIDVDPRQTFQAYADNHPAVPKRDPDYVFRRSQLSDALAWHHNSTPDDFLNVTGPTGTGKTSFVRNLAAALGVPVFECTAHKLFEFLDAVSQKVTVAGDIITQYGPLAQAYIDGGWFVLNDQDRLDPANAIGFNDVGSVLSIIDNGGEMIKPHPRFRFVITTNDAGHGETAGQYNVHKQDLAFQDRFTVMRVMYPTPDEEEKILAKKVPDLPGVIRTMMIRIATMVREKFAPQDDSGNLLPSEIDAVISTRTLIRWAKYTEFFYGANELECPARHALDRAIGFRCNPETRTFLMECVQRVMGDSSKAPKPLTA